MSAEGVAIGPFRVRASDAEAAAFRAATGIAGPVDETILPLTFPIRWLASSELRAALAAVVPDADLIPFHEGQSFAYRGRLKAGETYVMTLRARRESDPDRLVVAGGIATEAGGADVADVEMVLRLFPIGGAS